MAKKIRKVGINEQRNDKFGEVVEAVNELNRQVNAEYNHGCGYDTEAKREDFKQFFNEKFKAANDKYKEMLDLL